MKMILQAAESANALEEVLAAADDAGKTPLMHASFHGHFDAMEVLIEASGFSWAHHLPSLPVSSRGAFQLISAACELDEVTIGELAASDAARYGRAEVQFLATMRAVQMVLMRGAHIVARTHLRASSAQWTDEALCVFCALTMHVAVFRSSCAPTPSNRPTPPKPTCAPGWRCACS